MLFYLALDANNYVNGMGSTYFELGGCQTIELEIEPNHPILSSLGQFKYDNDQLIEDKVKGLETSKQNKLIELQQKCQEVINSGFTHVFDGVEYWFSLDMEAQQNFTSSYQIMKDGLVQEITWTVKVNKEYSRLAITLPMMEELAIAIMTHKTNNIAKFRDFLTPQVNAATTLEEVKAITW